MLFLVCLLPCLDIEWPLKSKSKRYELLEKDGYVKKVSMIEPGITMDRFTKIKIVTGGVLTPLGYSTFCSKSKYAEVARLNDLI